MAKTIVKNFIGDYVINCLMRHWRDSNGILENRLTHGMELM